MATDLFEFLEILAFLFIPGGINTLSKLVSSRVRCLLRRKQLLCKAGHQFNVSAMSFWNHLCKYEKKEKKRLLIVMKGNITLLLYFRDLAV